MRHTEDVKHTSNVSTIELCQVLYCENKSSHRTVKYNYCWHHFESVKRSKGKGVMFNVK
jgi:hypothetical protein